MRQGLFLKTLMASALFMSSMAFAQQQTAAPAPQGIQVQPGAPQQQQAAPAQQPPVYSQQPYSQMPQQVPANMIPFDPSLLQGSWVSDCIQGNAPSAGPYSQANYGNIAFQIEYTFAGQNVIKQINEYRDPICQGVNSRVIPFVVTGGWLPGDQDPTDPRVGQITTVFKNPSNPMHFYDDNIAPYETLNKYVQFYTPNKFWMVVRAQLVPGGPLVPVFHKMFYRVGNEPTAPN